MWLTLLVQENLIPQVGAMGLLHAKGCVRYGRCSGGPDYLVGNANESHFVTLSDDRGKQLPLSWPDLQT